jgi:hypothetical protein
MGDFRMIFDKWTKNKILKKIQHKVCATTALYNNFLNSTYHQWIIQDRTLIRAFTILFELINDSMAKRLIQRRPFIFLTASGQFSCTLTASDQIDVIIIFPDLIKLLRSAAPEQAAAVLAHELGHIYYQHNQREITTLDAQFEADYFAHQLGLGRELLEILSDYHSDSDCIHRVNRLKQLSLKEH